MGDLFCDRKSKQKIRPSQTASNNAEYTIVACPIWGAEVVDRPPLPNTLQPDRQQQAANKLSIELNRYATSPVGCGAEAPRSTD